MLTGLVTQGVIPQVLLLFSPVSQSVNGQAICLPAVSHIKSCRRRMAGIRPDDAAKPGRGMGTGNRGCDVAQRSGRPRKTIGTLCARCHRTRPATTVRLATGRRSRAPKPSPIGEFPENNSGLNDRQVAPCRFMVRHAWIPAGSHAAARPGAPGTHVTC
jgi:hypothetical protein